MDESWRMKMGMPAPKLPNYPPRRSTGNTASHLRPPISSDDDPSDPDDFADVFGGPPRTILSRQFSADGNCPRSSSSSAGLSYEDIFRRPEKAAPPQPGSGRKLPEFRIPFGKQRSFNLATSERNGFYGDVFRWDVDDESVARSRSRSKTSSSSALSSVELSPLRPVISDDGDCDVPVFGSMNRPINVRSKWNSNRTGHSEDYRRPFADCNFSEIDFFDNTKNYPYKPSRKNASSPESMSNEAMLSNNSFRKSADDDLKIYNSPSSPVSSVCDRETTKTCEVVDEDELDEDDDEIMSSYVIEFDIIGNNRERAKDEESNGVDEAIAWAKEKFQTYSSEAKATEERVNELRLPPEVNTELFQSMDDRKDEYWAAEDETSKVQMEMQILDEKIRLWSTGKEADIRLLLSSLHHILWPSSGWVATPLTNIIESSQVKKAYQKAQLCLHPDKLQQRGATVVQKYVAEKVFSALQDAWAGFISQDDLCSWAKPSV